MTLPLLGPYVYTRGVRNAFSLAFTKSGDLFSVENSGERDDPEEMNWIRPNSHYGFPWKLGENDTLMQFSGYDPEKDKLLNHNYSGYKLGAFYDDKMFPVKPKNLTYRKPIKNMGPDGDKYRDPTNGQVLDASDKGTSITSFTAHRSTLGLTFDIGLTLGGEYTGKAFVLSYQYGTDSYGPFEDPGHDLLMLDLNKNAAGDDYVMKAYRIAMNFTQPTDAKIVGNKLYVLQVSGQMLEITFPKEVVTATNPLESFSFKAFPNPTKGTLVVELPEKLQVVNLSIIDINGRVLTQQARQTEHGKAELDLSRFSQGIYFLKVESESYNKVTKILINP